MRLRPRSMRCSLSEGRLPSAPVWSLGGGHSGSTLRACLTRVTDGKSLVSGHLPQTPLPQRSGPPGLRPEGKSPCAHPVWPPQIFEPCTSKQPEPPSGQGFSFQQTQHGGDGCPAERPCSGQPRALVDSWGCSVSLLMSSSQTSVPLGMVPGVPG